MNIKELRIGSAVLTHKPKHGGILFVKDIECRGLVSLDNGYTYELEDVYPVSITKEVLLKCGFEHHRDSLFVLYSEHLSVDVSRLEMDWNDELRGHKVEYLHQLQNLLFALTGRELDYTP